MLVIHAQQFSVCSTSANPFMPCYRSSQDKQVHNSPDNRSLSISWPVFVNLTFYLHFGEEIDPISQFHNNNIFYSKDNACSIKEVTKNNRIAILYVLS